MSEHQPFGFIADPPSAELAATLQAVNAMLCEHGCNPCYSRCGVRRPVTPRYITRREEREYGIVMLTRTEYEPTGEWTVIPREQRDAWLARLTGHPSVTYETESPAHVR